MKIEFLEVLPVGSARPYTTIASAIAAAEGGDILDLAAETFTEHDIHVDRTLTIRGAGPRNTIVQAHADYGVAEGRVFYCDVPAVVLENMTIRHGNHSAVWAGGGGILNLGTLTLRKCAVSRNRAFSTGVGDGGAMGGGIRSGSGSLKVDSCTISYNAAEGGIAALDQGGGVAIQNITSPPTLSNSTVYGNSAGGEGGGVWMSGDTTLDRVTVAANSADQGGGVFRSSGLLKLKNTLVADNTATTAGADIDCPVPVSASYSLVEDAGGVTLEGSNNLTGLDPELSPLAENGGITDTAALAKTSPARDQGDWRLYGSVDQRGTARPYWTGPDIGAFEWVGNQYFVNTQTGLNEPGRNGSEGQPWATISYAIGRAEVVDEDMIRLRGELTGDGNAPDGIFLGKSVAIVGDSPDTSVVQAHAKHGQADRRVFMVMAGKTAVFENVTIRHGRSPSEGGAIFAKGYLQLMACEVVDNQAAGRGAGLVLLGGGLIGGCTLSGNQALTGNGDGGALHVESTAASTFMMSNSTLANNSAGAASGRGGGVFLRARAASGDAMLTATLLNNTIAANMAGGSGKGLFVETAPTAGTATVNLTVVNDVHSNGESGNYGAGGAGTLALTRSHTLVRDASMPGGGADGNLDSIDPELMPLGEYGGPTRTMALMEDSPARDSALASSAPSFDQRLVARPWGEGYDLGACEYNGPIPCTDSDSDGYGNPASVTCAHPELDCDDTDGEVNPGATEVCDGADNNCVGGADEDPAASAGCDNGSYCDGAESCVAGGCVSAGDPCDDDGTYCNGTESCDEDGNQCVHSGDPCDDDGTYCNGTESCDEDGNQCIHSGDPCPGDGVACTDDSCNEASDGCDLTPNDAHCDNGLYCDGAESCDPLQDCQAGTAVACDDLDPETTDTCNEGTDACQYTSEADLFDLPDPDPHGKIHGGDQSHVQQVDYRFQGLSGDVGLVYEAYDVDFAAEVEIRLNGVLITKAPLTGNAQWGDRQQIILPDDYVHDSGQNLLTFKNSRNPPQTFNWGVRQVSLGIPLAAAGPYGRIRGSGDKHTNQVVFSFAGTAGALEVQAEIFDAEFLSEVEVLLNGTCVGYAATTANNTWSDPQRLALPDNLVHDAAQNLLVFDNTRNPPQTYWWGVRNISVGEVEGIPLPAAGPYGKPAEGPWDHINQVDFSFAGAPGDLQIEFEAYDVDFLDEVEIILNGVSLGYALQTANRAWDLGQTIPLPDALVEDAAENTLVIRNTRNPPQSYPWGVRNLAVTSP